MSKPIYEPPYVKNGPLMTVDGERTSSTAATVRAGGATLEIRILANNGEEIDLGDISRHLVNSWNFHDALVDALRAAIEDPTEAFSQAHRVLEALGRADTRTIPENDDEVQARLHAWFQVLHRLARIQADDPMADAWTAVPLDNAVEELKQAGMIMVLEEASPKDQKPGQVRLLLRPEGWDLYDEFCRDRASQGRPIQGWKPGRHRQ